MAGGSDLTKLVTGVSSDNATPGAAAEPIIEAPIVIGENIPAIIDLLPENLRPYWQLVERYPALEAIIILGAFWMLAFLIRRYAISLIQRFTERTETDLDDQIIAEVRGPIFSTVIWLGVIISLSSAGFTQGVLRYVTPIALSLVILTWLRVSLSLSGKVFHAMAQSKSRFKMIDVRTEPLVLIGSKLLLLLIGSYILLTIWGINPVGLLASAGIVGIAFGFAAKDTLANLFSGMFILADRPYKLGDYVNLESGERGKITHIGIRSTRLITRDDIEVTIPNGVIGNAKVVNESGGPYRKMRVRVNLQCAYESDLDEVQEVLMEIANSHDEICQYPAPRVRVRGFAASGIDLQLLCWIDDPQDRGRLTHVLLCEVHKAFKEHNIEIPYPRFVSIIQAQTDISDLDNFAHPGG